MEGLSRQQFPGVYMNIFTVVEDLLHLNNLLCEIDIVDEKNCRWNRLVESAEKREYCPTVDIKKF